MAENVFENVLGLAHAQRGESSNHGECVHMFDNELDVSVKTVPSINGIPINGPRLYMPFSRRILLTKWGMADALADELLTKIVTPFSECVGVPLETFLLGASDEAIVRYLEQIENRGSAKGPTRNVMVADAGSLD